MNNFLSATQHAVLCQALGARAIKSVDVNANVGTTFSCSLIEPIDDSKLNVEAAQKIDVITNRLFVEPLLGLGYPVQDLKILHQLEKYIYQDDEKLMQCPVDFIGIQNYTREVVRHSRFIPYVNAKVVKASQRDVETMTMDWEVYPESIQILTVSSVNLKKKIIRKAGVTTLTVSCWNRPMPKPIEPNAINC